MGRHTLEYIKEYIRTNFSYDPDTGHLRRYDRGGPKGRIVGTRHHSGYIKLTILAANYSAHRIAWFLYTGTWLGRGDCLDHINQDRGDNRRANLRLATPGQNNAYRRLTRRRHPDLPVGVYRRTNHHSYIATIYHGKHVYLGSFTTIEEAAAAYQAAFNSLKGEEWNIKSLAA